MKTPETFTLMRTGRMPIRFQGTELAAVAENGTAIRIFKTHPDAMYRTKIVVAATLRRPGSPPYEHVTVCRRPGEVQDLIMFAGPELAAKVLLAANLPAHGLVEEV